VSREFDQLAELKALWKSRGYDRQPVNAATTDRFCEICLNLARRQGVEFPILACVAVPDANGVERWLCEVHGRGALEKRQKRLEDERKSSELYSKAVHSRA
jgi:hypothetical protein